MLEKRNEPLSPDDEVTNLHIEDDFIKPKSKCTIFLGYTSNMVSCGVRESILFLVKNKLVDCIVSSAGGIEEDFIKCLKPSYIGDYNLNGKDLRAKGMNRIGNMIVPNKNYCDFENWLNPILDAMLEEQKSAGFIWSPSKIITRLGQEINDESSIYYWAAKNKIPVFSPAITDGSIGDIIFFHSCKNSDQSLIVDIAQGCDSISNLCGIGKKGAFSILKKNKYDLGALTELGTQCIAINDKTMKAYFTFIGFLYGELKRAQKHVRERYLSLPSPDGTGWTKDETENLMPKLMANDPAPKSLHELVCRYIKRINLLSMRACNTGMVIIGGGLIKHHIANANLMRNGADYSVFLNTSCEYEGSDSGANPDEAVSWGKIKTTATPVKVYAEASLIFPLLVAESFYRFYERQTST
ncbi:putative deoxyhypusine synthase [Nymphon striatum]|nr:putative deoxyhypusine synthase [Nymphon striatum]